MVDLTVDVQVFMSGTGKGDPRHFEVSHRLLQKIKETEGAQIVVDDEGHLLHKFQTCSVRGVGSRLLQEFLDQNKVKFVKRARVPRAIRNRLKDQKFVGEDLNHVVRTAAASDSRLLVAHDPHFLAKQVRKILKSEFGIEVISAVEGIEHLTRS